MTVVLSLLTAFAWTAFNYWIVPIRERSRSLHVASSRPRRRQWPRHASPWHWRSDGVPGSGDLRPLNYAALAGACVQEVTRLLFTLPRPRAGRSLPSWPRSSGLEGGNAALARDRFPGERISVPIVSPLGSRSRSPAERLAAAQGKRRTARRARCPPPAPRLSSADVRPLRGGPRISDRSAPSAGGRPERPGAARGDRRLARGEPPGPRGDPAPARPGGRRRRRLRVVFVRGFARPRERCGGRRRPVLRQRSSAVVGIVCCASG